MPKRLATGAFADAEDVIRRALETLEAEENRTDDERHALDRKIDRALEQAASGRVYGPEEARRKLAELREAHMANSGLPHAPPDLQRDSGPRAARRRASRKVPD